MTRAALKRDLMHIAATVYDETSPDSVFRREPSGPRSVGGHVESLLERGRDELFARDLCYCRRILNGLRAAAEAQQDEYVVGPWAHRHGHISAHCGRLNQDPKYH